MRDITVNINRSISGKDYNFEGDQRLILLDEPIVYFDVYRYEEINYDRLIDKEHNYILTLYYGLRFMNMNIPNSYILDYINTKYGSNLSIEVNSNVDVLKYLNKNGLFFLKRKYVIFNPKYVDEFTKEDKIIIHSQQRSRKKRLLLEKYVQVTMDDLDDKYPLLRQTPRLIAKDIRTGINSIGIDLHQEVLKDMGNENTVTRNISKRYGRYIKQYNKELNKIARTKEESKLLEEYLLSNRDILPYRKLMNEYNIPQTLAIELNRIKSNLNNYKRLSDESKD